MREPFAWQPDAGTVADATLTAFIAHHGLAGYDALLERSTSDPAWFWNAVIDWFGIAFSTPYDAVMDSDDGAPWTRWCVGGETNLAANCLDPARHDDAMPAIAWEAEDGTTRHWSRAELRDATARLVHVLQGEGIGPGDAVGLYLPMLPETVAAFFAETVAAFFAVAALGGVVVPLFSGFAADAAADRLNDAGAVALLTTESTPRRGRRVAMKPVADAIAARVPTLRRTLVLRDERVDPAPWTPGRDEAGRRRHCGTGTDVASNAGAARRTGRRA
jgi:acetyl-CoA synthetase